MQLPALYFLISAVSVSPIEMANADFDSSLPITSTANSPKLVVSLDTEFLPHLEPSTNYAFQSELELELKPELDLVDKDSYPQVSSKTLVEPFKPTKLHDVKSESVAGKTALLCPIDEYEQCLWQLPNTVVRQLPSHDSITFSLGLRSAVVMPVDDNDIAGIIVLNNSLPVLSQSVVVDGDIYQLDLAKQSQLTLWHEIGHLENIAQQGKGLPIRLSHYEHEWLADIYLTWRVAHQTNNLTLAWQQFHRRNMAVINNNDNMSHWSSPQLLWLLTHYQQEDIIQYDEYSDFITEVYPQFLSIENTEIMEISSLIQRTFTSGTSQPLPRYMFWRQARLIEVLQPTLVMLMGSSSAEQWLIEQFSEAPKLINAE
ncbi:hypothetical protein [Shewanella goraebulensis]|uniref:hypothetical protein n=1 Tax=Shewanella goraebulensis TaxID=3050637 RepID=UPI00254BB34C|nr:hypothetical protein [Shewanella goraebulensis]